MRKTRGLGVVATDEAPKAIGPYSQGITTGGWIFTAGQVPLDPRTGDVVGATIVEQTERVLLSLAAILREAGATLGDVVKTTVYLVDLADFPAMNEVYAKHFGTHKPARATVQVAALPKGVRVEIDAVAAKG